MIHDESEPRIIADIEMLHSNDGGRMRAIAIDADSRYMPHLVIDDRANRVAQQGVNGVSENYMGVWFAPALAVTDARTGSGRYPLRLMYHSIVDYTALTPGATFTIREGDKIVGHGVVVDCDSISSPQSIQDGG